KEWHRHQSMRSIAAFHLYSSDARQPDHTQYVLGRSRAADHVVPNGLTLWSLLQASDGSERIEHVFTLRVERFGCPPFRRSAASGRRDFAHRHLMTTCMLPDIERVQVQAKGPQLQQQRINQFCRDALAAVLLKALAQQQ